MSKKKSETAETSPDFESAIKELESLVEQLENGELTLADSLHRFERGVALSRECHDLLEQARLKVTQLSENQDQSNGEDSDRSLAD